MSDGLLRKLFIASLCFLLGGGLFGYGLAVGKEQLWPYAAVHSLWDAFKSLITFGRVIPTSLLVEAPADASRQRFRIYQPGAKTEGYYAFLGWDDRNQRYSVWLYDSKGTKRHTWAVDYAGLDADGPLNHSDAPHAFLVLPDGSLIVNFDNGDVMPRLDACGRPVWIKHGVYHHSLEQAGDGTVWTWRGENTPYGHYHYLESFDPETGRTIKSIGLVEDIIKRLGPSAATFGIRPDYPFMRFDRSPVRPEEHDIFHPNDVDPLRSALAPKFPQFDAGDLLLSFRNLHLVVVVDPKNERMKWWSHGPWRFQHDPDFTADGTISVYTNNSGSGRSEIIKMDPVTRRISNDLFHGELRFYSDTMGNHQYLPNGNVLVVVSDQGRALVVSRQGEKVLEFNNVASDAIGYNGRLQYGLWIPADYMKNMAVCAE